LESFVQRSELSTAYFKQEAKRMAGACHEMSERFLQGGRLLAFGKGAYTTDAQHVSVEFVHPVIVGKRALPALDVSLAFKAWCNTLVQPRDMVLGFAPPAGDGDIDEALSLAKSKGALTLAFSKTPNQVDYLFTPPSNHPFIHQELVEIFYHTLWETVHVFFERQSNPSRDYDSGAASFLYPFLSGEGQDIKSVLTEVAASIQVKVAEDVALRQHIANEQTEVIVRAVEAISQRVANGGKLIVFGNGGSATDANDFVLDCIAPPFDWKPVPALSLALEPANLSAIANDIGVEVIFLRQLIAQANPKDVAIAISTSGGSKNVVLALEQARKRKLLTIALLGYDGGEIVRRKLADIALVVPSDYIPRIQEVQASLYHVIREGLSW
jgi:D-sedoheptulose 7-phosphate isomerase